MHKICICEIFFVPLQRQSQKSTAMKTKCLKGINAILAFLVGLLGFTSCEHNFMAEYGVPSGDLTFKGKVTNEEQEALEGIQVVRCGGWQDDIPQMYWEEYADTLYTNSAGEYYKERKGNFPLTYHKITVTDPSGTYESKDTIVTVQFKSGHGWYEGRANLKLNFTLKKK